MFLNFAFIELLAGEFGEEFFDLGVEEIDVVIAFGDFPDEVFIIGFEGAPEVAEHGADDFGGVHDFACALGHGEGGAVEGAVVDVAWAEGLFFTGGGFGNPAFDEFAEGDDEGRDEEGFEDVEASVGVGDVVGECTGGLVEPVVDEGHEAKDEAGGAGFCDEVCGTEAA